MVYFVKCHDFVKIGYCSNNLDNRLLNLQCGNPYEIELLYVLENGKKKDETTLQSYFSQYHFRGEWFHLTEEIHNFITNKYQINLSKNYGVSPCAKNSINIDDDKLIKLYQEGKRIDELAEYFSCNRSVILKRIPSDIRRKTKDIDHLCKSIKRIRDGQIFETPAAALKDVNLEESKSNKMSLQRAARGERKHFKGESYCYVD